MFRRGWAPGDEYDGDVPSAGEEDAVGIHPKLEGVFYVSFF